MGCRCADLCNRLSVFSEKSGLCKVGGSGKNPKLADVKEAVEEIKAVVEKAKTGIKKMHAKKVLAKKPLKVKKAGKPAAKKRRPREAPPKRLPNPENNTAEQGNGDG